MLLIGHPSLCVLRPTLWPRLNVKDVLRPDCRRSLFLTPFLGPGLQADSKLCPVRAVKCYLSRTHELRGNRQEFFFSFKSGHSKSIAPATFSSWIKKTIFFAYQDASDEEASLVHARVHDLRAQASSWNLQTSASLDEILRAAQWRTHSTFSDYYLKDMSMVEEDLLRLGPIVTGGRVSSSSSLHHH